ncbi:ferritin [Circinella umbellata]|nr:ferritin [Circinella umbellata]
MENSIAKQNFSIESENGLNQQIQIDQIAQQQYLSAAAYFDRDDVALPGLVKHFLEEAEHEGERVQTFIDYQQMRGGVAIVKEVPQPSSEYASARMAVEASLALEKDVNKSLLNLTSIALNASDTQMKHWLKSQPLTHLVENIEKVAKGITQLERTHGEGLGLYLYDQAILNNDGEFTV